MNNNRKPQKYGDIRLNVFKMPIMLLSYIIYYAIYNLITIK